MIDHAVFDIETFVVGIDEDLRALISCIDRNAEGIALVLDGERRLLATVTDGDVRRGMLAGIGTDASVKDIVALKGTRRPLTASATAKLEEILSLMAEKVIRHVPLVDEDERVIGLALLNHLALGHQARRMRAVVMAGGFGKRLHPLTTDTPKPLLPVGDKPILERILCQLESAGIKDIDITTHYMSERIVDYVGDGSAFGINASFHYEEEPLGTAGALGLMDHAPHSPVLVMNGDILTDLNFQAMHAFHNAHSAQLTVAVRAFEMQVPYGVVEAVDCVVDRIVEKPSMTFFVNAGIYLVEPSALAHIPKGQRFDMPDLIQSLIQKGETVVSFPIQGYWLDIGRPEDYQKAMDDAVAL